MELGIRFSSPTLDKEDYNNISEIFNIKLEELKEVVENAPQEMSIIVSLIKKLSEKINELN